MRPALRYHGGKWLLADWLISLFPRHRVYVEPYGGAMSVLLSKPRSYAEIYNEKDGEIVNVFKMLRERGPELQRLLQLTPFARSEFVESYADSGEPLESARKTIIKSFMGFGSDAIKNKSGFRANPHRSGTTPAGDWANYGDSLSLLTERLRGVVIEQREAIDVILQHDSIDTFYYVDPPYVHSTRSSSKPKQYRFEMTDDEHRKLADILKNVKGKVLVSGYQCDLYEHLYNGWYRHEKVALADGASPRLEVAWANFQNNQSLGL